MLSDMSFRREKILIQEGQHLGVGKVWRKTWGGIGESPKKRGDEKVNPTPYGEHEKKY